MAKPLVFTLEGAEIPFQLKKVDRTKLYGFKEAVVLDENDDACELATLAGDGRTVIGKGGTGMGYVSPDGSWCDRGDLVPVDLEGDEIEPVPSSYSAPVPLDEESSVDELLAHNVRAIYVITAHEEETAEHGALLERLREGAIFKFPYSFRGGLEADAGFLVANGDGEAFLAVGSPTVIQMVALRESAAVAADEEEPDEDDLMDMGML